VCLKLECLQETGSFKVRGATNVLATLTPEQKHRGVIAFSTGNHGRAVAHVAGSLGIRAVVCLSNRVPEYRVQALEALGAEVVRHGRSQDEAYTKAIQLQKEQGLTMVKPFDDPAVIAGQGTIGLELIEDLPDLDTVLVPLSGGGLMAGIAFVLKSMSPRIRVIGLSLDVSAPMHESLKAGRPVEIEEKDSLGDALLGGIGLDNELTFPICRDLVDEVVLISEQEIADGLFYAFHNHRLVVEGAGIVGLSALVAGKATSLGHSVAVVLSGGNVDTRVLAEIVMQRYGQGETAHHEHPF
jgi:threonine dehydratase